MTKRWRTVPDVVWVVTSKQGIVGVYSSKEHAEDEAEATHIAGCDVCGTSEVSDSEGEPHRYSDTQISEVVVNRRKIPRKVTEGGGTPSMWVVTQARVRSRCLADLGDPNAEIEATVLDVYQSETDAQKGIRHHRTEYQQGEWVCQIKVCEVALQAGRSKNRRWTRLKQDTDSGGEEQESEVDTEDEESEHGDKDASQGGSQAEILQKYSV